MLTDCRRTAFRERAPLRRGGTGRRSDGGQLGQCAATIPYLLRAQQLEPPRHQVKDALDYAQRRAGSQAPPTAAGGPPADTLGAYGHGEPND
jgi:hypothetical protein